MEKKIKNIIEALSHGPVQRFILDHEHDDIRDLVLKHKALFGIPTSELIQQIATRRKAKEKLPLYYSTPGIIFPPSLNFEQSSSQATAIYKAEVISQLIPRQPLTGADITGGFGVDTYFFSRHFDKIHYVEPEPRLMDIARYNHLLLKADNIVYHNLSAEEFIRSNQGRLDFVYLDPSRRTMQGKKIHGLDESQPDVLKLKEEIFRRTSHLVLKASPLLDIHAGLSQLGCVKKVFVISVNNECREVLFFCEYNFGGVPSIEAVNLSDSRAKEVFEFSPAAERDEKVGFSDPLTYLYEPNASILKAGAFKSVATRFGLKKLQTSTHLYTSENLVSGFPGRTFLIEAYVRADDPVIKKYFPEGKANVTTRNYPLSPEALKKKARLKDGGEKFLIGFSGEKKKYLVVASKI